MVRGRIGGRGGRAAPSWNSKFSAEQGSTPASSPYGYYFRWSDDLQAYDLSSYNSEFSDHQINENMIVTFFKDVHSMKLKDPKKTNWLHVINLLNLFGGIICAGLFYLFGYTQSSKKTYTVVEYSNYKYVSETSDSTYLIYTPMIGMAHFLLGVLSWLFINMLRIEKMRLGRFTLRIQAIREIFQRHRSTTFSGLNVSIVTGSYGGYIGLLFDWKKPAVLVNPGYLPTMGFNAFPPGLGDFMMR